MEVQSQTQRGTTKKRTPKGKNRSLDLLVALPSEVCGDQTVKHRSSQPHVVVHPPANPKRTSSLKADDTRTEGLVSSLYLFEGFPRRQRSKGRVNHKNVTKAQNADFHGDQVTKSIASKPHYPARQQVHKKRKSRHKDEETSDNEVVYQSLGRERLRRRVNCESGIAPQQGKLDTNMFERYFENVWKSFSEEKRNSFTYLDCLWFSLYTKESSKAKVLKWIKKKCIFSKTYVFVPIIQWSHWSLLIFCHLGESLQSKSRSPCILLLDSLQMTNPRRLEPGIRKFVVDIYNAEERPEDKKQISRIPFKIPKVPQQRNGEECGNCVLYYMKLFIESAPENFGVGGGYPYFMKEDWFTHEGLDCFSEGLVSSCQ